MSKNPLPPADFTPDMGDYRPLRPFRYWCQKVLPLVYDDSLSYYELLCKVVDYLNKTMEDVGTLHGDVDAIRDAYEQLQGYVNTYFDNLDVQEEINEKLDQMFASGTLTPYFAPYVNQYVTEWLASHVTPTSPALDKTLTINGAAAEAHYTGHRMQKNAFIAMLGEPHDYATINRNLVIPGYRVQGVTYNNGVFYVCGGSLAENGTGFIATMTDLKFKDFQITEIPRLGHANDITYSAMDGYLYVCSVREGDAPVNGIWKINPNDFTDMTLIDNAPENTVGIQYRWGDYWILAPYRIYATTDFQTYEVIVENTNDMLTQYDVPTTGRLSQSLVRTPDHIIGWVASFVYDGVHYGAITYFSATGVPIAFDMFPTFGAEMECACYANMGLWGICDGNMVTVLRAAVLHDEFVQLKAGDDLDDFTGRGVIYSTGANVSGQLLHSPVANEGFTLTVERQGLYNTRQDARSNSGREFYRIKSFNAGTWGDWVEPDAVLEVMISDVSDDLAQVEDDLTRSVNELTSTLEYGNLNQHIKTVPFVIGNGVGELRALRSTLTVLPNGGIKAERSGDDSYTSYGFYFLFIPDQTASQTIDLTGHKIYFSIRGFDRTGATHFSSLRYIVVLGSNTPDIQTDITDVPGVYETILTPTANVDRMTIILNPGNVVEAGELFTIGSMQFVDLTAMFGAGQEPTLEDFREVYSDGPYPFLIPTVSADTRMTREFIEMANNELTVTLDEKIGDVSDDLAQVEEDLTRSVNELTSTIEDVSDDLAQVEEDLTRSVNDLTGTLEYGNLNQHIKTVPFVIGNGVGELRALRSNLTVLPNGDIKAERLGNGSPTSYGFYFLFIPDQTASQTIDLTGHKIYFSIRGFDRTGATHFSSLRYIVVLGSNTPDIQADITNVPGVYETIFTPTTIVDRMTVILSPGNTVEAGESFTIGSMQLIDLTAMFGAGQEPTLEVFRNVYSDGPYPFLIPSVSFDTRMIRTFIEMAITRA